MMTEEQIISKLQTLKEIKPRENWAVFAKARIFEAKPVETRSFNFNWAYAFAALLMVAGIFGFGRNIMPGDQVFQPAALSEQATLKQSITKVADSLKNGLPKDVKSAKELTIQVQRINEMKTLADSSETVEINNLDIVLGELVEKEVLDLEKASLTQEQQKDFREVKDLYKKGEYAQALEKILTIGKLK